MNSRLSVDKVFSAWLVKRSLKQVAPNIDNGRGEYSIAIESPCQVCQPRVAGALTRYLNEFDDSDNQTNWLEITDHRLEQLQAHPEFRRMLHHESPNDPDSAIDYLTRQGGVVLELPQCHARTSKNPHVFQVSLRCQEPVEGSHHLWINAKRIPAETLVPMIANAFVDWTCNGGDRVENPASQKKAR
jgi:hypothetical protein